MSDETVVKILQIAKDITQPLSLLALIVIVAFLLVVIKNSYPRLAYGVLFAVIGVVAAAFLLPLFVVDPLYHLRVSVRDPAGHAISIAPGDITCPTALNEPKKIGEVWQFDVPAATLPKDRKISIHVKAPARSLEGDQEVPLGDDRNVPVTFTFQQPKNAHIIGIVIDKSSGALIEGAQVAVAGYDGMKTGPNGNFDLDGHVAENLPVMLHTEKKGYKPDTQSYIAGPAPVTIYLVRLGRK